MSLRAVTSSLQRSPPPPECTASVGGGGSSTPIARRLACIVLAPAEDAAREHDALDLVRALVDLSDLGVSHQALDGVLAYVAVPPERLDAVGRHRHGDVRRIAL